MSASDLVQATVVAPSACLAEWSATGALLQSADAAATWLHHQGLTAYLLTDDRVLRVDEKEQIRG